MVAHTVAKNASGQPAFAAGRVSVVGDGQAGEPADSLARELGERLAGAGLTVVCGGLGGVMRAVCQGAHLAGGRTVGILPGTDASAANEFVDTAIATGLGPMRNFLVVLNGDVVVAVDGGYGTLSEVALALKLGRTVIGLGRLRYAGTAGSAGTVDGVVQAGSPAEAVDLVVSHLNLIRG